MQELIKINDGSPGFPVSARELHSFLENKDMFANWIKDRIKKYDFIENQDYIIYLENTKKGRPSEEYSITISMAKELAMVERNENGKIARTYFIACENKLRENFGKLTKAEMLLQQAQVLVDHEREIKSIKSRVEVIEARQETHPEGFFAVSGFASLYKIKIDRALSSKIGKMAAAVSRENGYSIGSVSDEKYGSVKTYHKEVLEKVFKELNLL